MIRRTVYFVAGIVVEKRIGSYREALREFNEDVAEAVRDYEEELLRRYAPDFQRQELPEASRY